jgi:hypothetical protein
VLPRGHGHGHRKQDPGQQIGDRRTRRGGRAELGPGQPSVVDDPGEYGERRHGHRHREEQNGSRAWALVVRVRQHARERGTQGERQQCRERGCPQGDPAPSAQDAEIDLRPDSEHEQREAHAGERAQQGANLGREEGAREPRAEQGGAQQNAGEYLADHRRLAQRPRTQSQDARKAEDQSQVQEEKRGL